MTKTKKWLVEFLARQGIEATGNHKADIKTVKPYFKSYKREKNE